MSGNVHRVSEDRLGGGWSRGIFRLPLWNTNSNTQCTVDQGNTSCGLMIYGCEISVCFTEAEGGTSGGLNAKPKIRALSYSMHRNLLPFKIIMKA